LFSVVDLRQACDDSVSLPLGVRHALSGRSSDGPRLLMRNARTWGEPYASDPFPDLPIICLSGQPSAAAIQLLHRLRPGTQLQLSCDHDLGGLRIAWRLLRLPLAWHLWRMDPADYDLARTRGHLPLARVPDGDWGPLSSLAEAMVSGGQAAHQEVLLPELIADARRR
jgi:Protein of unknown function C-terminus (DUF2399)